MSRFVRRQWRSLLLGAIAAIALFAIFRVLGLGTGTYFIVTMGLAFGLALWGAFREEAERRHPDDAKESLR